MQNTCNPSPLVPGARDRPPPWHTGTVMLSQTFRRRRVYEESSPMKPGSWFYKWDEFLLVWMDLSQVPSYQFLTSCPVRFQCFKVSYLDLECTASNRVSPGSAYLMFRVTRTARKSSYSANNN